MAPSNGKRTSGTEAGRRRGRVRGPSAQPTRRRPQLPLSASGAGGAKPRPDRKGPSGKRSGQTASAQKRSALIERAQASLPGRGQTSLSGRGPARSKGGLGGAVKDTLASFGSDKSGKPSWRGRSGRASKTGMVGLAAGAGLGAAALTKRRRSGSADGAPLASSPSSAQTPSPTYSEDVAGSAPAT